MSQCADKEGGELASDAGIPWRVLEALDVLPIDAKQPWTLQVGRKRQDKLLYSEGIER